MNRGEWLWSPPNKGASKSYQGLCCKIQDYAQSFALRLYIYFSINFYLNMRIIKKTNLTYNTYTADILRSYISYNMNLLTKTTNYLE